MPMNRVQFQPGLSMFEFLQRYGTEGQCEDALAASRWPEGWACPRCGGANAYAFRRGRQPYRECVGCRYQCSLIAGTMFEGSKLPLRVWFLAMQLLSQAKNNVAALELRRQLGVSYPTAWLIKHKIMEAMRQRELGRQLSGRVEIDDAYLGGERTGGKPGRGSENKVPFVVALQTAQGGAPHLLCMAQLPFRRTTIAEFAAAHLVRPLTVVSDGLDCFRATAEHGVHDRIVSGGGKASTQLPEFRWLNTVLGNFKTAIAGTYHAFKFAKYGPRYLAEVQFRFNRRYNLHRMLPRLLHALLVAQPCPESRIRAPEACC
jgi:hypothetical protein